MPRYVKSKLLYNGEWDNAENN